MMYCFFTGEAGVWLAERQFTSVRKYAIFVKAKRVAVQLDMETFEKIEQILEGYALIKAIQENDNQENLTIEEAKQQYQQLRKAK